MCSLASFRFRGERAVSSGDVSGAALLWTLRNGALHQHGALKVDRPREFEITQ